MSKQAGSPVVEWRLEGRHYFPVLVYPNGKEQEITWSPLPGSQVKFLQCPVMECLYEGTRGPGKTDSLLMDFIQHVGPDLRSKDEITLGKKKRSGFGENWNGILFRQTYPQLSDVIKKAHRWFPRLFPRAQWNEGKSTWTWPTGEKLKFAHGLREADYWNFHGHEYSWLAFEELTTWADDKFFKKMLSTARCSADPDVEVKIRATTNPYGPGHNWVKRRYGLPVPSNRLVGRIIKDERDVPEDEREPDRVAVHGYLDENKILLSADPGYKGRIRAAARNAAELAAWLDGDWNVTAGGMFDDIWDENRHVVPNFAIPHSWRMDRSFDWGSQRPFSVGWWAVSDGSDLKLPDGRLISTVRGDLFRVAEWYGWTGQENEGLSLTAQQISQGIVERELQWGIYGRVKSGPADSQIYTVENGVSIANDMALSVRIGEKKYPGIQWHRADKSPGSRISGWETMRQRLQSAVPAPGLPREFPGLFVCQRCEQFIRTVPPLPRDMNKNPDDVDTEAEDHIADDVRYRVRFEGRHGGTGTVSGMPC